MLFWTEPGTDALGFYLHAGGAICSNGSTESVEVSLNNGLDKYSLKESVATKIRHQPYDISISLN